MNANTGSSPRPCVAAIGGGHGLSNLLRGMRDHTDRLTGIVTVFDDGGGSGMLRSDLNMLPPGDIRNCLEALANADPLLVELLGYRFTEGSMKGQAFGNLMLAALDGMSPTFDEAVDKMSRILRITGRVLPVSNDNLNLQAVLKNGDMVVGQCQIPYFQRERRSPIHRVSLNPGGSTALPAVLDAIREADLILLGPGSLYTSVIPNLLVDGVADAIRESQAPKLYVANIMTQSGETGGMSLSDHIQAILDHGGEGLVDLCLANSAPVSDALLARYRSQGAEPMTVDREQVEALGVRLMEQPLITPEAQYAFHAYPLLARAIMEIYETVTQ